jgi:hypothetical protein
MSGPRGLGVRAILVEGEAGGETSSWRPVLEALVGDSDLPFCGNGHKFNTEKYLIRKMEAKLT